MATTVQAGLTYGVTIILVALSASPIAAGASHARCLATPAVELSLNPQEESPGGVQISALRGRADVDQQLDAVLVELRDVQMQEESENGDSSTNSTSEKSVKEQAIDDLQDVQHFVDVESLGNRWYRNPWELFDKPIYEVNEPGDQFWDPYRQNILKGDFPIDDDDLFFRLTVTERIIAEGRNVPTPRGITSPDANTSGFFGDGDQLFLNSKTAISFDLFRGQEAFKPVDWRVRITPVFDITSLNVNELGVVNPNVGVGKNRHTTDIALQEALVEIHLFTFNERYDFMSSEIGIFAFRSDFRGFIFDDANAGVRLFGNADDNKWQYNAVFFNMLEKDSNSELNTLDDRDQYVFIANLYRQDFLLLGYNAMISFHWNHDRRTTQFNDNDFLIRPQPVGLARPKEVDAYYLGFAGDGHFGRWNVTHAFYHVFGTEENNAFASRDTDINAQFAALEVSYDMDWIRFRVYGMYASGDDRPLDGKAKGFDAIMDAPNFAGGEFSYFNRQDVRLLGVGLTGRLSFLPDLTTSKFQGQANFVNPGLLLVGAAMGIEITPTWRAQLGVNYMRFAHTEPLELYLEIEDVDREIGTEIFFGTTYRPLLTNNIVINAGAAVLFPGDGMQKLYQQDQALYSVFLDLIITY